MQKFKSLKPNYFISTNRKETEIKENQCISQITMQFNAISEIYCIKTKLFYF